DYAKDFIATLPQRTDCFSPAVIGMWVQSNVQGYFELLKDELQKEVREEFKRTGSITEKRTEELFVSLVTQHRDKLGKLKRLPGIDPSTEKDFRSANTPVFRELAKGVFQSIKIGRSTATKLYFIATYLH